MIFELAEANKRLMAMPVSFLFCGELNCSFPSIRLKMANPANDYFTKLGTFNLSPTRKVAGELSWQGEDSYLYIGDDYKLHDLDQSTITGYLHDLKKVTLIDCVGIGGSGTVSNNDTSFHHAKYFPHYIITGNSHFDVLEENIAEFSFVIEDVNSLFYDLETFNLHFDRSNIVSEIVKNQKVSHEVKVGEMPIIAYYTGTPTILEADTDLGLITVNHKPSFNTGGPGGVNLNNSINIAIRPSKPVCLEVATQSILDLLRFLDVILGRAQKINSYILKVENSQSERPDIFEVYLSLGPAHNRPRMMDKDIPSPFGVLIDPVRRKDEFIKVLTNWLKVNSDRRVARQRFSNSFMYGRDYSINRLISAANMFDILPNSAVPRDEQLSDEIINAKTLCSEIFTALPDSYERSSMLNALGRIGKSSLKHKIRHRLEFIKRSIGNELEDIQLVADEAVNCRNYYVHGSKTKIDYSRFEMATSFFTDTLEFIFAISELIEAGWGANKWFHKPSSLSHPFVRYRVQYKENIALLKEQLNKKA